MSVIKCPRCEINFIREEDGYCLICKREIKGEAPKEELPDMCIECGEHPAAKGEDLCIFCIKERDLSNKLAASITRDDIEDVSTDAIDMEDIEVTPQTEDIPGEELEKIHKELDLDGLFEGEVDEEDEDEEDEDDDEEDDMGF